MNFGIALIILSFVPTLALCTQSNSTRDGTCDLCQISWFRRKRAQTEYTRWRANQETTQEFIVKVLDEDLTTFPTHKIVAVNIQSLPRNEKKIIIGGALVPPTTSLTTTSESIDYTRFIPPTTIPLETNEKPNVMPISGDSNMYPRGVARSNSRMSQKKLEPVKHIERDESPPSGPQFLGRTKSSLAQQYAPVAPVSFFRGTTVAPLTPRFVDRFTYKTPKRPTRTFPTPDVIKSSRTSSKASFDEAFLFDNNYITDDPILKPRSSILTVYEPQINLSSKSTILTSIQNVDENFSHPPEENFMIRQLNKDDANEVDEKEPEVSYNFMISDYEEDKEKKKTIDSYKEEDQYEIPDFKYSKGINESLIKIDETDNSTGLELNAYIDEDKYAENLTSKHIPNDTHILSRISETRKRTHKKLKNICSLVKLRQLNFNSPRTLPEIVAQLKQWAETSPVAKWIDITNGNYTTMENPIYMMIVDDPSSGQIISAKKTVMVIAGIQGRDHHSVAAAMYVLYQLIERSESHADLLTKYRFWVIPIFNPDGYDYSMTFPQKREWAKNLRQKWDSCKGRESCESCELYGLRCTIQACYGVNLDRNFEYQWIPTEELRAEHPCGALYAGERQLSEPETRALTQFLHERRAHLFTFIAFKEGDVLGVLYPYSHTRKRRAFDNIYRQRASQAAAAAYSIGGRPYVAGQTSEFLPLYAGGIEDWVDGHLGIDNTYTVMMFRPSDSYNTKLITERVVHEAYAAMDTLLLRSADSFGPAAVTLATAAASSSTSCSFSIVLTSIYFAFNH